jgi:hypothetical protein
MSCDKNIRLNFEIILGATHNSSNTSYPLVSWNFNTEKDLGKLFVLSSHFVSVYNCRPERIFHLTDVIHLVIENGT